jgi:hypothetical protein
MSSVLQSSSDEKIDYAYLMTCGSSSSMGRFRMGVDEKADS